MTMEKVLTMRFICNGYYSKSGEGAPRCPNKMDLTGTLAEINQKFKDAQWKVILKKGTPWVSSESQATNCKKHICGNSHLPPFEGFVFV